MVAIKKVEKKEKSSKNKSKVEKKKAEAETDIVVTKKPKSEKKEKKQQLQADEIVTALTEKPEKAALTPEQLAKIQKRKEKQGNKKEARSKLTATEVPEVLATEENLVQAVKTVTKAFAKERSAKNVLFDDDTQLLVQIQAVKYPTVPKRMVSLTVPNKIIDETQSEICFIITDMDTTKKREPEGAIEAFKERLAEANITYVKTIIPLAKLKKEYSTFELKKKLSNSYDLFLIDGKISGQVCGGVLRKAFQKRNKLIPVTVSGPDLKKSIEAALHKTRYLQPVIPQLISIAVGNIKMKAKDVASNVVAVLEQLKTEYIGGWLNIQNIHLKPAAQSAIVHPVYISTINPNLVTVPEVVNPKFNKMKKISDKLNKDENRFKLSADKLTKKRKAPKAEEGDAEGDSPKKAKTEKTTNGKPKLKKGKKVKEEAQPAENGKENELTNGTKTKLKVEENDDAGSDDAPKKTVKVDQKKKLDKKKKQKKAGKN